MRTALLALEWAALVYFLIVNTFYLALLLAAVWEMRRTLFLAREEARWRLLGSEVAPSISMIAPAHDEAATVAESVTSLLTLSYPRLELVVVNDGSTDETLEVLRTRFDLVEVHPAYGLRVATRPVRGVYRSRTTPNLVVVDKENGGKADALNAGLNVGTGELVCAVDVDTLIEPDALLRVIRPFVMRDDVVAAGGSIRVVNGSQVRAGRVVAARAPRRVLPGIQAIEYLRAFLFGRTGWNVLGGNLIISGAFGLFRREAVLDAGGYVTETVGEDMELVLRMRRTALERGAPGRVRFVPDPVAWTEVPDSLRMLGRQRDRWHRGLSFAMWNYRRLVFNPRYGALGMVVLPYFFFIEWLGPILEALGVLGTVVGLATGVINVPFALLFFLVAYGYGVVLSMLTLVIEELSFRRYRRISDRLLLMGWAVLDGLGYRQLTAVWRLRGLVKFVAGRSTREWGAMDRRGFATPDANDRVTG